ncbi:uncharacterized protein EV420DRAFT_1701648 [Desarmillaria tabescens]|uniref:Uncharacterized protein n=1 Tax=Armillaria tabescens TaxID=1929756 RepID=A0AA39N017_ARMTA|nr:uncharacterized protein EV420DRAFT_1701648 [Desarmillaria tabescens]KAK0452180.1 hypothetical protein EV420DRAFT_1701648 [Desarmillaria tabescens]
MNRKLDFLRLLDSSPISSAINLHSLGVWIPVRPHVFSRRVSVHLCAGENAFGTIEDMRQVDTVVYSHDLDTLPMVLYHCRTTNSIGFPTRAHIHAEIVGSSFRLICTPPSISPLGAKKAAGPSVSLPGDNQGNRERIVGFHVRVLPIRYLQCSLAFRGLMFSHVWENVKQNVLGVFVTEEVTELLKTPVWDSEVEQKGHVKATWFSYVCFLLDLMLYGNARISV